MGSALAMTLFGLLLALTAWLVQRKISPLLSLLRRCRFWNAITAGVFYAGWIIVLVSSPWLIPFVIVPIIIWGIQKRKAERSAVLWQLSFAVGRGLPLVDELEAIAPTFPNRMKFRLIKLAYLIDHGNSLPEALLKTKGIVPRETAIVAQLGLENGHLAEVLRSEAIRFSQTPAWVTASSFSPAMFLNYLIMVPLVGMNLLFFLMWWIIPKFKKIFESFNMELPSITKTLIAMSDFVVDYFYAIPMFALILIMAYGFYRRLFKRRNKDISLLPVWRGFSRRYRLPALLRLLSQSVTAEQPITAPLKHLAAMHHQGAIRNAAAESTLAIEAGGNVWKTLQEEGLLKSQEAELLASAERTGNLPWMMNELASGIERNRAYRWMTWLQFIEPVIIVLLGLVVAFTAIGMFIPLVELINALS